MLLWKVHGVTSESVDGSAMLNGINTLNITRFPSKTVSGGLARFVMGFTRFYRKISLSPLVKINISIV
jgi:hypothetical protein